MGSSLEGTKSQILTSLAFFFLFVNYALVTLINDYIGTTVTTVFIIFPALGAIVSGFLCPFFLPVPGTLPGKDKPLKIRVNFILSITVPNIILRSLGLELWMSSSVVSAVVQFFTGMLYPVCCGLFISSFLAGKHDRASENKTGKYCVFIFTFVASSIFVIRFIFISLFDYLGFEKQSFNSASFAYNTITGLLIGIGIMLITSIVLGVTPPQMQAPSLAKENKTNWSAIFCIIGLTAVYQIVNALLNMRLFLSIGIIPDRELTQRLLFAAICTLLGFIAGFSIRRFLRYFLPFTIILFILIPSLALFGNNPPEFIIILKNMMGGIVYQIMWAVFTVAIIENYYAGSLHNRPGFWFYMLTGYYVFINLILLLNLIAFKLIPDDPEYTVIFITGSTVLFFLLSFRIIFPKTPVAVASAAAPKKQIVISGSFDDIFTKQGLSKREKDVAHLIVTEGLKDGDLAARLNISIDTVRSHIKVIYQKFFVNSRGEFMALFVNRES